MEHLVKRQRKSFFWLSKILTSSLIHVRLLWGTWGLLTYRLSTSTGRCWHWQDLLVKRMKTFSPSKKFQPNNLMKKTTKTMLMKAICDEYIHHTNKWYHIISTSYHSDICHSLNIITTKTVVNTKWSFTTNTQRPNRSIMSCNDKFPF